MPCREGPAGRRRTRPAGLRRWRRSARRSWRRGCRRTAARMRRGSRAPVPAGRAAPRASRGSRRRRPRRAHILGVQFRQPLADALVQAAVLEELAKGMGGGGEARGRAHAVRQLRDHFAEAGVLAAHYLDVGHSQVFKRYDQAVALKRADGKTPEVEAGSARRRMAQGPADGLWCC